MSDTASTTRQQENSVNKSHPLITNAFLPEPFPTVSASNSTRHWHDAFGSDDAGVDYGPPNSYEDDEDDDDDDELNSDDSNHENSTGDEDEDDENDEEEKPHPTITTTNADRTSNVTPTNNSITIEELEEEVDLHTRTLESISIKLQTLDEEIQKEEEISSSLRNDIQLFNQRKLLLKKRKEKSRKLIEELEESLQKCVERLGGLVGGGYDNNGHAYSDDAYADELGSEIDDGDGIPGELPPSTADIDDDVSVTDNVECDQEDSVCHGNAINSNSLKSEHDSRGKLTWPSSELVHEIHLAAEELPVIFPTWRTNALSMSLLRGIDSEKLLVNVMNVAALENLLKREEWLQSSDGKSHQQNERGVRWINEADIWGTCLDVYTHVNWKSLFAGFRRVDMSMGARLEAEWPSSTTTSKCSTRIDPNIAICPYELGGTCADIQCSYQHLERVDTRQRTIFSRGGMRKPFIRCNNVPKLKLPRLFTREDFIFVERGGTSVDKQLGTPSLHAGKNTMNDGHEEDILPMKISGNGRMQEGQINDSQRYYCPTSVYQNDLKDVDAIHPRENIVSDVVDYSDTGHFPHSDAHEDDCGLEFIALPTAIADLAERDKQDDNCIQSYNNTMFNGRFWWQQIETSPFSKNVEYLDTFDCMLLSFGYERKCSHENERASHSLKYIITPTFTSESHRLGQDRIDNIIHLSRLIDLSRVLVHMGRDSLALCAMSDYCQSRSHDTLIKLVEWALYSIKSLLVSRCASSVFNVQVNLLSISEALHFLYQKCVRGDGDFERSQLCIDDLIDQMRLSSFVEDRIEKKSIPTDFKTLVDAVRRSIPSSINCNREGYDDWNSFIAALRSMIETLVINLSQMGGDDKLAGLYQCTCVGKMLRRIIGDAAMRHSFAPLLHVIEPIWGSLQSLLRPMSRYKRLLHPDIIGIVIIGPLLFECSAYVIAPPRACARSHKLILEFDPRDFANVISLDMIMFDILKELNRSDTDALALYEVLLTPLFAFSATVCIARGSLEQANARLEHLICDDSSTKGKKRPTVYALSEMIWSQLVQIQMICSPCGGSLTYVDNKIDTFHAPMLPDTILMFHREIASRVLGSGKFLWGVSLRGDSHMNMISPCFNRKHCKEWEKVAAYVSTDHDLCDEIDCDPSVESFHSSNPFSEFIGTRVVVSVFPETLLLLADKLISLNLENCALMSLPSSLGHQITNLRHLNVSYNLLSELPESICFMAKLEHLDFSYNKLKIFPEFMSQCSNLRVLNVSYNQLESVPTELALRCLNLQSLFLNGNPAITSSGICHGKCRENKEDQEDSDKK